MRIIVWTLALSTWLLFSAFLFTQTAGSAALTGLVAVLIGTFGLAAPGLPILRVVNAAIVLLFATAVILMPGVPWLARGNDVIVSAVVLFISLVPGRATHPPRKKPSLRVIWRRPAPPPEERAAEEAERAHGPPAA